MTLNYVYIVFLSHIIFNYFASSLRILIIQRLRGSPIFLCLKWSQSWNSMFKVHLEILRPSRLLRLRSLSRNLTLSENQPCNSNSTASYVHMYTYPCYSHAVKPRNARRLYVRMTSGLCVCETRSKRSVIWSAWLFESDDLKHDGKARQEIHLA